MYSQIASLLLTVIYAYAAVGGLVALAVLGAGLERVDHEAEGAGIGFRAIIFPGAVALWPLLLVRAIRGGGEPPLQKDPHR